MSSSTSISKTIVTTNAPENIARSSGKSVSAERTLRLVPDGYLAPGFLGLRNTSQWIVAHWPQFIELLLPRRARAPPVPGDFSVRRPSSDVMELECSEFSLIQYEDSQLSQWLSQ